MKQDTNWNTLSSIIQTIVGIVTLIISIVALSISIKAIRLTNEQFIENSKSANEQFRNNLDNSRQQFDSLINQLEIYKEISSNQLKLSKKQLAIIDKILHEYIYLGRPTITVSRIHIRDTNRIIDDSFAPIIEIPYKNSGERTCFNIKTICKAFNLDKIPIHYGENFSANNLESNFTITEIFRPKLNKDFKNDFYLYFEINYQDLSLNQWFNQKYYFHYYSLRGSFNFYECNETERLMIDKFLKKVK
jgi:hypothetical protein